MMIMDDLVRGRAPLPCVRGQRRRALSAPPALGEWMWSVAAGYDTDEAMSSEGTSDPSPGPTPTPRKRQRRARGGRRRGKGGKNRTPPSTDSAALEAPAGAPAPALPWAAAYPAPLPWTTGQVCLHPLPPVVGQVLYMENTAPRPAAPRPTSALPYPAYPQQALPVSYPCPMHPHTSWAPVQGRVLPMDGDAPVKGARRRPQGARRRGHRGRGGKAGNDGSTGSDEGALVDPTI